MSTVLADLRQARRRQRTAHFDAFEALYRVYITAVVSTITVLLLSGLTGDNRVSRATALHVGRHDAALVGLAVALCWAVGLRSGGRGGPLVIEAADVRHVLLSPVPRRVALRPLAIRQLRFGALVGSGIGAVAGLLAYRRLPGGFAGWIALGALVGSLAVTSSLGLAMLVAGRRLGRLVGGAAAAAVVAWSGLDVLGHLTTSPATFIGEATLWPLQFRPTGIIGLGVAAAAVVVGLAAVSHSSLEAAERRATLVGQIRFAATLQDLRTVVVLRRQLAQELPRQRPWIRVPRSIPAAWLAEGKYLSKPVSARRWPVWRRGWHGILRFPGLRLGRLGLLGVVAGVAALGAWRGTTPLLAVAGVSLYVAGLDAAEPLAQEIDHPDRTDGYAMVTGELWARQLVPSVVVMLVVGAFAALGAWAASGGSALAAEIAAVLLVPAALSGLAGAAISVVQGAPAQFSSTDAMLPPEAAGGRAIVRIAWPLVVATIGVLPLLAGRGVGPRHSPVAAVAGVVPPVLIVVVLVGVWIRYRAEIHAWFRRAMEEAKSSQRPAAPSTGR